MVRDREMPRRIWLRVWSMRGIFGGLVRAATTSDADANPSSFISDVPFFPTRPLRTLTGSVQTDLDLKKPRLFSGPSLFNRSDPLFTRNARTGGERSGWVIEKIPRSQTIGPSV